MPEAKQVICIRRDLKMRRGKECAQAAHASMAWLTDRLRSNIHPGDVIDDPWLVPVLIPLNEVQRTWIQGSFVKICVRVDSEEELLTIHEKALEAGLLSHLITDSGRTEFNGIPTPTAVAIGPNWDSDIDPITSHLTLY